MRKPLVFVSHVQSDATFARKLVFTLRAKGADVFVADHTGGGPLSNEIRKAIERAQVFVVLVSKDFLSSHWGMFEVGAVVGRYWESRDSIILPVLMGNVRRQDIPPPLRQFHAIEGRFGEFALSNKVIAALSSIGPRSIP